MSLIHLATDGVRSVRAADVQPRPVDWLWEPRIATGGITVLAGMPGVGKSLLVAYLAGQGSRTGLGGAPFSSLLLGAEDSLEHVVRPRLEAIGGDLNEIHLVEDLLAFPERHADLDNMVMQVRPRLIVIDPFSAYLGRGVDSWKDASLRGALAPLHQIAQRHRAAVVLVAHLNKGQGSDPLRRIGGSVGLAATARSALLMGCDPDEPEGETGTRRVVAHIKSNLGEHAPSLLYTIEPHHLAEVTTARLVDQGAVRHDGRDLLRETSTEGRGAVEEACQFLKESLAEGPLPAREVDTLAKEAGISGRTLRRARTTLDVKAKKIGDGWVLTLPPRPVNSPEPSVATPSHAAEHSKVLTF